MDSGSGCSHIGKACSRIRYCALTSGQATGRPLSVGTSPRSRSVAKSGQDHLRSADLGVARKFGVDHGPWNQPEFLSFWASFNTESVGLSALSHTSALYCWLHSASNTVCTQQVVCHTDGFIGLPGKEAGADSQNQQGKYRGNRRLAPGFVMEVGRATIRD